MKELEINKDSVHYLINCLCCSILQEYNLTGDQADVLIPKLKALSYEVLLKKSSKYPKLKNEFFDPERALEVQIFTAKLIAKQNPEICNEYVELEEKLKIIRDQEYFQNDFGKNMLQLLLALQHNPHNEKQLAAQMKFPSLLVPAPFTLYGNQQQNSHYPRLHNYNLMQPKPEYFQSCQKLFSKDNPYLPKFLFDGEKNQLQLAEHKYAANSNTSNMQQDTKDIDKEECSFTGLTKRLLCSDKRINCDAFSLFSHTEMQSLRRKALPPAPTTEQSSALAIPPATKTLTEPRRIFSWNWESLGLLGVLAARPFAGETDVSLLLQSHLNELQMKTFETKIVKYSDFLQSLKLLTVGIQSDVFQHDKYIVFTMLPNLTIAGVLPQTVQNFVVDFLECGTCYKRLQTMTMKKEYKLMFEGFIFKALCGAIDEYLFTFRQYVFAKEDKQIMEFYNRMKNMMKQITNLSYTLAIHPNVNENVKPPMGSQFLGYIYREIMRLTDSDYITLLLYILKRCCHVYFRHLQKWIYYGVLDDPSDELFIGFVDHYRSNTKYYYDKAYFIRRESVPGFFHNYEEQILQCGKYTMLLKAYKANHPLFNLEYPTISVCLSFSELKQLEEKCQEYSIRARNLCLKQATLREMLAKRAEQRRECHQRMVESSLANLERWLEEQREIAITLAEQKRKRWEELTYQLEDAKQRKINERKANVERELRLLKQAKLKEEQEMLKSNINLRKRLEYYQELSELINEQELELNQAKLKNQTNREQPHLTIQIPTYDKLLNTPSSSTAETEFESCFGGGDADEQSEYEECQVSPSFTKKFAETEQALEAIYHNTDIKNNNEIHNTNTDLTNKESNDILISPNHQNNNTTTFNKLNNDYNDLEATEGALKRSISDVINSNNLPATIMEQNRFKAMAGTEMNNCLKEISTELSKELAIGNPLYNEAQRNRLKVLTQEFALYPDTEKPCPKTDLNLNQLPDEELTDLQRNRKRVMRHDLFTEYNRDPLEKRMNRLELDVTTERARNRQKVLESEYNILTGKSNVVNLDATIVCSIPTIAEPATPMSTTSDDVLLPFNSDCTSELQITITENMPTGDEMKDVQTNPLQISNNNNNNQMLLKIANDGRMETPDPNTSLVMEEPIDLLPKHEDELSSKNQNGSDKEEWESTIIDTEENHVSEAFPTIDYTNPYERCVELLETNFKCNTRSPYIRLNQQITTQDNKREDIPTITTTSQAAATKCPTFGLTSHQKIDSSLHNNVNSMSVITLTEFLQKSVIIPLQTHLNLVNGEVMRLFLEDLEVFDHFRSLRNYFFLMDGEFGSIICDGIIGKLESGTKPATLLNYQTLHSILDTALGSSLTGKDKNAENLSFIVSDIPSKFDLMSADVLNSVSLSYRVEWPLNLILNPETLDQYGKIFKYLIRVRRISWILERAYQMLKQAVKTHGSALLISPQYRHIQLIRHKFYHFVHVLQNHITANALLASWKTFKDELLQATTIEDIYRKHTNYIKRIIFLCMLNKRSTEFYNTIENIFKITLRFYNNLKSREFVQTTARNNNDSNNSQQSLVFVHARYDRLVKDELKFDKFIKYTIYLGNKIVQHGYQTEIGEFINLINFNQYYM